MFVTKKRLAREVEAAYQRGYIAGSANHYFAANVPIALPSDYADHAVSRVRPPVDDNQPLTVTEGDAIFLAKMREVRT